jgi:hypothetical protein
MDSNLQDEYLQSFRQRTGKFRGDTLKSRVSNLASRWSKVASDCDSSDDNSRYRQQYGETHTWWYNEALRDLLEENDSFILSSLQKSLVSAKSAYLVDAANLSEKAGVVDAMGYIIAELESILTETEE